MSKCHIVGNHMSQMSVAAHLHAQYRNIIAKMLKHYFSGHDIFFDYGKQLRNNKVNIQPRK